MRRIDWLFPKQHNYNFNFFFLFLNFTCLFLSNFIGLYNDFPFLNVRVC